MRPRISWADLAGARVGVWGLGVEGRANLRRLRAMGLEPVLVDDRGPASVTTGEEVEVLATAAGGLEALVRCDVVVKAPGISRYRPEVRRLADAGVAITGGLGLWLEGAEPGRVACVTGTKGKSTTTTVAAHLLRRLGYPAVACGNLGLPPWDPESPSAPSTSLPGAAPTPGTPESPHSGPERRPGESGGSGGSGGEPGWWIVETSSFQATDLSCSPAVVAVTALHPDHLDWHGDAARYYADKLSACTQPGATMTVAAGDDPLLRSYAAHLGPVVRWVGTPGPGPHWSDPLGLAGAHNRRNAGIAQAVLTALGVAEAADEEALREAADGFDGLESRLRPIGTVGGVTFVDDSLSTNVLSTLAALAAFPDRRVALLVGGHDRGIDYAPLAGALARREAGTLVATLPDNGPRIAAAIRAASGGRDPRPGGSGPGAGRAPRAWPIAETGSLEEAVAAAYAWARPDGVVLLSPAAPSFGRFADYRARAAAFAAAMTSCT